MNLSGFLETFTGEIKKKKLPDYPKGYCNIATKSAKQTLENLGVTIQQMFTTDSNGGDHTFLVTSNGVKIDPTYGQYDPKYPNGFVGKKFPNKALEGNVVTPKQHIENLKKKLNS